MNEFIDDLCEMCDIDDVDMLGQPLKRPTKHHIIPQRSHGKTTFQNIAILDDNTHRKFNKLEVNSPELAKELNYYMYIFRGNLPEPLQERVNILLDLVDSLPNKSESMNKKYKKKSNYKKELKRHKR